MPTVVVYVLATEIERQYLRGIVGPLAAFRRGLKRRLVVRYPE